MRDLREAVLQRRYVSCSSEWTPLRFEIKFINRPPLARVSRPERTAFVRAGLALHRSEVDSTHEQVIQTQAASRRRTVGFRLALGWVKRETLDGLGSVEASGEVEPREHSKDRGELDSPSTQFRFGSFRLDPGRARLWRDTEEVALPPKVFDLLCYLVRHAGELVTKDQLLDAVWQRRFVSESSLKGCGKGRSVLPEFGAGRAVSPHLWPVH
jgi:hypothetical protein